MNMAHESCKEYDLNGEYMVSLSYLCLLGMSSNLRVLVKSTVGGGEIVGINIGFDSGNNKEEKRDAHGYHGCILKHVKQLTLW